MTSWTVLIFSASSSEISISYSSSKAMTSSTMSSESAPRSSMNEASGVTSSSLTPSCSQTISFTLASTDDAMFFTSWLTFSLHVESAVHVDDLPRDIRGARTHEESHRFRHILRGPKTRQGDRAQKFVPKLF